MTAPIAPEPVRHLSADWRNQLQLPTARWAVYVRHARTGDLISYWPYPLQADAVAKYDELTATYALGSLSLLPVSGVTR